MQYISDIRSDKKFKTKKDIEWEYFSNEKIEEMYPEGGYKVIGEINKKDKKNKKIINTITNEDDILNVYKKGYHNKFLYKKIGYIKASNDEYIYLIRSRFLMLLLLFLAILLIIGGGLYIVDNNKGPKLDQNAKDYVANIKRPDNWDPTKITIPGYDTITILEGSDVVKVALWNPDENPCYFEFDIVDKETDESFYKTGIIPPGRAVSEFPIDSNLEPGIYNLIFKIKTYSLEDHTKQLNGANVSVKLNILKE